MPQKKPIMQVKLRSMPWKASFVRLSVGGICAWYLLVKMPEYAGQNFEAACIARFLLDSKYENELLRQCVLETMKMPMLIISSA